MELVAVDVSLIFIFNLFFCCFSITCQRRENSDEILSVNSNDSIVLHDGETKPFTMKGYRTLERVDNKISINKLQLIASNYSSQRNVLQFAIRSLLNHQVRVDNYSNCLVINKSHELISIQNLFTTFTAAAQHQIWTWSYGWALVRREWNTITQFVRRD